MEEVLKAWIAGFFEGEGSIAIGKGHSENWRYPQYALQVVVSNSDLNRLNRFLDNFNGHIHARILSQDKRALYYRKPAYQWSLHGAKASKFLEVILPYLVRRNQAEIGIEFQKTIGITRVTADVVERREDLYNRMKVANLNGKGKKAVVKTLREAWHGRKA